RHQPRGHQKGRPIDRMKADDVLADDVDVGRPKYRIFAVFHFRIAERGDVVDQRVEPDVNHMAGMSRHRNAPGKAGARDRTILQARLDEADDLVAPAARSDGFGVRLVPGKQPVLPCRKTEEVVVFLVPFDISTGRRLAIDKFSLVVKGLIAYAIPTG